MAHRSERPLSRSYGVNLPSSLERALPRALVYSTHELQMYGVEPSFRVNTPLIILTNLDMELMIQVANANKNKIKPDHIARWEALLSRGTYIDLKMNTPRWSLVTPYTLS